MLDYRGVAYYPEFWPQERWDEDIRLMKEAGINIVRMGEFAWTAMEPAEDKFDLDWLHKIVRKMRRAGIDVMLCTPTAAPPAWLTGTYPESLLVRRDSTQAWHGQRRHYCPTNHTYRRHCARIAGKLAGDFAQYANVVAYQIDNELGPEKSFCHCTNCAARWRVWLRARYGSLQALNDAWQSRFWSVTFTDWDEIDLRLENDPRQGGGYPSIELDMRRFFSETFIDFAAHQAGIIRSLHPSAKVTSNFMGPIYTPIDYYKMADLFDVVCDDLYFDIATMSGDAAACDVFRRMAPGKDFWITETGSGALSSGKGPWPDQLRAWMYSAIARGSKAHFFFRWRTCLAGQEQHLQGILDASGKTNYRFEAVKRMFGESTKLGKKLGPLPLPEAQVAIISSYDAHWAYEVSSIGPVVKPIQHFLALHEQFFDRNVLTDVIPPDRDLRPYKLVVLPTLCIVDEDLRVRLKAFVRKGGVVVASPQLASRDANNNLLPRSAPDELADLFGFEVDSHNYLDNHNEADQALWWPEKQKADETVIVIAPDAPSGLAAVYMEELRLKGAKALAHYADNLYSGHAAVTCNRFGKGRAYYLAAFLDQILTGYVLEQAMQSAGVPVGPATDKWVEVVRRGDVTFAINHSRQPTQAPVPKGKVILGEVKDGQAILPPYGVCVVQDGRK